MINNKKFIKVGGAAVAFGVAFGVGIPVGKSLRDVTKVDENLLMLKVNTMNQELKDQLYLNNEMLNKEITKISDTLWRSHDKESGDLNNLAEDLYKMRNDQAKEVKHILSTIDRQIKPMSILKPINDLSTAITTNYEKSSTDVKELNSKMDSLLEKMSEIKEEIGLNGDLLFDILCELDNKDKQTTNTCYEHSAK